MRPLKIAALTLTAGVIAGGAGAVSVGSKRTTAFNDRAQGLEQTWTRDLAAGVLAASIDPLRTRLEAERPTGDWWSPTWWLTTGTPLIDDLQAKTDAAYAAAVTAARQRAQMVLDAWGREVTTKKAYVLTAEVTAAQAWPAQLKTATTPKAIDALAQVWRHQVDVTTAEASAAEAKAQARSQLDSQLNSVGGIEGLLNQASNDVSTAQSDTLDAGPVPGLITTMQTQVSTGADATKTATQLLAADQQLRVAIGVNDKVAGEMHPIWLNILQAEAEGTPGSGGFMPSYNATQSAFSAARTIDQLNAVQAQVSGLQANVTSDLTAARCGHIVGAGKVITLSLSLQEAVMYQDGCVVNATPITTGRPQLPTPAGNFHVFFKTSPWIMHSSWPPGSPFWYPDSLTHWVLEFAGGGYFLHDASWEGSGQYGPGSENGSGASHGCVHIPTPVMRWLYDWAPIGTAVNIS